MIIDIKQEYILFHITVWKLLILRKKSSSDNCLKTITISFVKLYHYLQKQKL